MPWFRAFYTIYELYAYYKLPYLGKLVSDMTTSPGFNNLATSSLRYFMFASTILKWASNPPYGLPGVPSIMYAPYSGLHRDLTPLK